MCAKKRTVLIQHAVDELQYIHIRSCDEKMGMIRFLQSGRDVYVITERLIAVRNVYCTPDRHRSHPASLGTLRSDTTCRCAETLCSVCSRKERGFAETSRTNAYCILDVEKI